MKRTILFLLLIFIFSIPLTSFSKAKHISKLTIGANLNSQIKPISVSGEAEFIDANGFSIFLNRSIPIGSIETGLEFESYEGDFYFFYPVKYEMNISIFYIGYNLPIRLPLGIQIIPGLRCGLYSPEITIGIPGNSDSNRETYTFVGFATRVQLDIIKGFGVYAEGNVKRVDQDDDLLKIQAGIKYTF